ncbi:MAG: GGDEF domain-containing protein [Idiomarina sp.]|nr:GGDEF domain-containing protein [Idiomarina sp.]
MTDVTESYTEIEDLRHRVHLDELTKVLNRRGIEDALRSAWNEAQLYNHPLIIMALDLDNFKNVNDEAGHEQGDWILQQVAGILEGAVRDTDIVGRLGGDEFVIVLPGCPLDRAESIAAMIVASVSAISAQRNLPAVTMSIGIAAKCPDDQSELDLLRRADKAAYQAKHAGRNQWVMTQ